MSFINFEKENKKFPMKKKKGRPKGPVPGSSKFARVVASSTVTNPSVAKKPISTNPSSDPLADSSLVVSQGALPATPVLNLISQPTRSVVPPLESVVSVEAKGALPVLPVALAGSSSDSAAVFENSSAAPLLSSGSSPHASPNPISSGNASLESSKDPAPAKLPWAQKFKSSLRNLKQMDPLTFLEDGTQVVVAPTSILLKTAEMWKGHIVAQFHGLCPPPSRIFSDLNPIWGRYGNITVRMISETASLIFIPAIATRDWVLDVGFWQAGNCSCSVYPWSPAGLLEVEELQTAPTWAILKNIPPQLYSLDGISVIASGIGEPLHTEKS